MNEYICIFPFYQMTFNIKFNVASNRKYGNIFSECRVYAQELKNIYIVFR